MKINKSKFLVLIMGILSLLFFNPRVFGQERMDNKFLVLTLDNAIIGPVIADYISRGIDEAQDKSYTGIIIQMDTPGGLLESTRVIVKKIMNASVPVIVYITPSGSRAGSAGVFITLAAHIAAMAPSTNIGAAHPVVLGEGQKGENSLKKAIEDLTETLRNEGPGKTKKKIEQKQTGPETETPMEDKILNDTLAWISTIAKSTPRGNRPAFIPGLKTGDECVPIKLQMIA